MESRDLCFRGSLRQRKSSVSYLDGLHEGSAMTLWMKTTWTAKSKSMADMEHKNSDTFYINSQITISEGEPLWIWPV